MKTPRTDYTLEELKVELAALRPYWRQVALVAGVAEYTLQNITRGITKNPGIVTVEKIQRAIESLHAMVAYAVEHQLVVSRSQRRDDEGATA